MSEIMRDEKTTQSKKDTLKILLELCTTQKEAEETMEQYGDFKSIEEKCIFLKDTFHLTVVGHNDELDEVTYQFLLATVINLKWH